MAHMPWEALGPECALLVSRAMELRVEAAEMAARAVALLARLDLKRAVAA